MTPPDKADLITVREAKEVLGFTSEEYVRRLARQGRIPALKAGPRAWLFSRAELEDWRAAKGGEVK